LTVSLLNYTTGTLAGNVAPFVVVENTSSKQRVHLENILLHVTCDATVVTRYIYVSVLDRIGNIIAYEFLGSLAASGDQYFTLTSAVTSQSNVTDLLKNLPKLWLNPFEKLKVWIFQGTAGDVFTVNVVAYNEKVAFGS
jgi:hypothetical protein